MRTIGTHEARTRFGTLLNAVEGGETVVITRYGVPVARIEPIRDQFEVAVDAIED